MQHHAKNLQEVDGLWKSVISKKVKNTGGKSYKDHHTLLARNGTSEQHLHFLEQLTVYFLEIKNMNAYK